MYTLAEALAWTLRARLKIRFQDTNCLFLPRIFLGTASSQFLLALCAVARGALQFRGFCFPGSSRTSQVPPIKHPLAFRLRA